jgi:hypothetical protein
VRVLIGIDDTDNLESRGTGHLARQLGARLADEGIDVHAVSRHQLLVDPRIPYTSHNSSACLDVTCGPDRQPMLIALCRDFLLRESAPGSDAGLCVAPGDAADDEVVSFGRKAKEGVLAATDAHAVATARAIHLEGLTGTRIGVIGALAAVALRAGGNDGRCLWLPGLREARGIASAAAWCARLKLDGIETEDGRTVGSADRIDVGDWPRPLLRRGRVVLLVEPLPGNDGGWRVMARQRVKELSA